MTEQEKEWFEELVKDREENARILSKDSMAGYRQSPIDKYSDRAHFIYEFLQNADDVKASKCKFALSRDGLLFEHNGIIPFKVSNPITEGKDRLIGNLGGVNAITAAGLSIKSGNEIGRFGIGFKAVFQYTDEPRIYDDNIFFGLKKEIVPFLIKKDLSRRKPGETYFCVPFRANEKYRAYSDIKEKIESLKYPLLFLSNLKEISFESSGVSGQYTKEICDRKSYKDENQDINVEFIILKSKFGDNETRIKVLKFSKDTEAGRISVVFGINNNDGTIKLDSLHGPAFCFFPTKKDTGLNFLIHAPFLLNDSREGIKEGTEHNNKLIHELACLAVAAIYLFVSRFPLEVYNWFGRRVRGVKLVDDKILDYVPLKIEDKQDEISLKAFEQKFREVFSTQSVIPCQNGNRREIVYRKKENVCWSSDRGLINLLTSRQLGLLFGNNDICWGFSSVNSSNVDYEKVCFVRECCGNIVSWSSIQSRLTAEFIECQPIPWFEGFFEYLGKKNFEDLDSCKTLPIFLNGAGMAVSAFDRDGYNILYIPEDGVSSVMTINQELMKFKSVKKIVEHWKIQKESKTAEVVRIIRDDLVNGDACVYTQGFIKVLGFCDSCSGEDLKKVGDVFKKYPALMAYNPVDEREWKARSEDCYFINEDLLLYFKNINQIPFVDVEYLNEIAGKEYCEALKKLFSVLEIRNTPKCITVLQSRDDVSMIYGKSRNWTRSYYQQAYGKIERWEDFYLCYSKEFLDCFMSEEEIGVRKKMSGIFWKFLCKMIEEVVPAHERMKDEMVGIHHYFQYGWKTEPYTPYLCEVLRNITWLFDVHGELCPYVELFVETLNEMYDVNSAPAKQLLEFLGIEHDERLRALNTLSDDERQDLEAAKDIREAGIGSMAEVKSILGIIPEEIRQKISSGKLTAEKISKAVSLLELSEIGGCVPTIASKDSIANIEQGAFPTTIDTISALTSDGKMGGLAVAEQHNNLIEAKKMVKNELELEGFEFTQGICEDEFSLINGVKKDGVEYPLVVHSYKDQSRPFQLTAADWEQLMKLKSMLIVCTKDGVCPVPFKNLVCNRDKIDFSISTKDNLDMSDRIASLAHVMRWFRGLRFDFGSLIPMEVGTAQLFDLPENPIPKGGIQAGSVEDL